MDSTTLDDETLAEVALDAAVASIQDALGVTDGGFAGIYFSGHRGDFIRNLLKDYVTQERMWMAAEQKGPTT